MMQGFRLLQDRIDPCPGELRNGQAIPGHQLRVDLPAIGICVAFLHERRTDAPVPAASVGQDSPFPSTRSMRLSGTSHISATNALKPRAIRRHRKASRIAIAYRTGDNLPFQSALVGMESAPCEVMMICCSIQYAIAAVPGQGFRNPGQPASRKYCIIPPARIRCTVCPVSRRVPAAAPAARFRRTRTAVQAPDGVPACQ